jgi:hypothetical protein
VIPSCESIPLPGRLAGTSPAGLALHAQPTAADAVIGLRLCRSSRHPLSNGPSPGCKGKPRAGSGECFPWCADSKGDGFSRSFRPLLWDCSVGSATNQGRQARGESCPAKVKPANCAAGAFSFDRAFGPALNSNTESLPKGALGFLPAETWPTFSHGHALWDLREISLPLTAWPSTTITPIRGVSA